MKKSYHIATAAVRQRHREFLWQKCVCLLILVAFMVLVLRGVTVAAKAPRTQAVSLSKYYTSVEIKSGDTLWSIAAQYMEPEYENMESYIEEVMALNHLASAEIHAGSFLVVPYYVSEAVP